MARVTSLPILNQVYYCFERVRFGQVSGMVWFCAWQTLGSSLNRNHIYYTTRQQHVCVCIYVSVMQTILPVAIDGSTLYATQA